MNKPLALFDVDKTLYDGLSYFPLLEAQIEDGLIGQDVMRGANDSMQQYAEGAMDYEDFVRYLLDIYTEGLAGRPADEVIESTNAFFDRQGGFFGYAKPTVEMLQATHENVLVTGGTQFTAAAVGRILGVSAMVSSVVEVEEGHITGRMQSYLATRYEKRDAIAHLTDAHPYESSFGFGDSEGDLEMLRAVEHAICIQPTPGLREVALQEGWQIVDSRDELASTAGLLAVKRVLVGN